MSREEITKIYRDNEPLKIAVHGHTPRLAQFFKRVGLPITEPIIKRALLPYREEAGASRFSWTRTIICGLQAIGQPARAKYLAASFAILPDTERRKMAFPESLEQLFGKIAAMSAAWRQRNYAAVELVRLEMIGLLQVELI